MSIFRQKHNTSIFGNTVQISFCKQLQKDSIQKAAFATCTYMRSLITKCIGSRPGVFWKAVLTVRVEGHSNNNRPFSSTTLSGLTPNASHQCSNPPGGWSCLLLHVCGSCGKNLIIPQLPTITILHYFEIRWSSCMQPILYYLLDFDILLQK